MSNSNEMNYLLRLVSAVKLRVDFGHKLQEDVKMLEEMLENAKELQDDIEAQLIRIN